MRHMLDICYTGSNLHYQRKALRMKKPITEAFDLAQHLSDGIEALIKEIIQATIKHPAASVFFMRYALAAKRAGTRRRRAEENGEHIPSFLIASITGQCNLRCAGCYDRANQCCAERPELRREDWHRIFLEAEAIGVSIILLAGGEPLMRLDVIEEATLHPSILFPVFTNGTILDEKWLGLCARHRNIIPIVSIEGDQTATDTRRGEGIYARTLQAMERMRKMNLLFGASITITSKNLLETTNQDFISNLRTLGCKTVVFVEYVPVERPELALNDSMRNTLEKRVAALRERGEMIIISFPGDEKASGGCLAAGRGFFHINAAGGVEPCPFSPYSDTNLQTVSLRVALQSPLFARLREEGALDQEHTGGCTLFTQAEHVRSLVVGEVAFTHEWKE